MKTNTSFFTLLLNAIAAGSLMLTAQSAAYIKFDGVDGESQDKDHKAWSDLLSFSQGVHQPGGDATGQSRRRGDVILEDIVCVKELDKSSPKIAESVMTGKVFPSLTVNFTRDTDQGRVTYYRYELTNVLVTSYSVNIQVDESGNDVPVEQFSLNYEEIKVTYTETDEAGRKKGNVEYSWKVEKGEAIAAPNDDPTPVRELVENILIAK